MMGLFGKSSKPHTKTMTDKHMPPISIRRQGRLVSDPVLDLLVAVPVYNYLGEKTEADDLSYGGCPYTASYDMFHWSDNATFANTSSYLFPVLREPLCEAFNLNIANTWNYTYP